MGALDAPAQVASFYVNRSRVDMVATKMALDSPFSSAAN